MYIRNFLNYIKLMTIDELTERMSQKSNNFFLGAYTRIFICKYNQLL